MGSYFSKNEPNDDFAEKKNILKSNIVSYTYKSTEFIDPISLILKYIEKENIIKENGGDEHTLIIEHGKSESSLNEFLPVIKYIGRTNNLYPNRNYFDCSLVDKWLGKFIIIKTLLNLYKENKISSEYYFCFKSSVNLDPLFKSC